MGVTSSGSGRRSGRSCRSPSRRGGGERLDVVAVEEPKDALVQLSRALARNDLDERCLLGERLVGDRVQRTVDVLVAVGDVVQIEFRRQAAHRPCRSAAPSDPEEANSGSGCAASAAAGVNRGQSEQSQSDWSKKAAARRAISSADILSMRWLSIHCCPNGSRSRPARSP
jgi:hypothetical protein